MILVDTNILLDVLARRDPFSESAALLWSAVERGEAEGCVSATRFHNIYYILRKYGGEAKARMALRAMREVFRVVALAGRILNQALESGLPDFEDAIQLESATSAGATHLVTRDPRDLPAGPVAIATPEEYLAVLRVARAQG